MSPLPAKTAPKPAPSLSGSSWDDDLTSNMTMIIQGAYGAGKTTLALTLSKFFPQSGLVTTKHKGPPKHVLKDLFWICFDKGALLSLKERGIAVPRFDVRQYMAEKGCSILQATEVALREAEKAVQLGAQWVIPDTLSTYDKSLDAYWQEVMLRDKGLKEGNATKSDNKLIEEIQIPKYGRMFVCHKMFHDNLMSFGCGVCYLTHSKALIDLGIGQGDDKEKQKKSRAATMTASGTAGMGGGGILVPDITGKGAGVYKADARLQLVVKAIKGAGGVYSRKISADFSEYENKNSWELSIKGDQEANLSKLLAKITG